MATDDALTGHMGPESSLQTLSLCAILKLDEEVAKMAMPESIKRDWELLTEQNKRQTRTFISFLLSQQEDEDSRHFKPQTEEQLFERIDRSLVQIEAGNYQDVEDVEAELMAKYGIAE